MELPNIVQCHLGTSRLLAGFATGIDHFNRVSAHVCEAAHQANLSLEPVIASVSAISKVYWPAVAEPVAMFLKRIRGVVTVTSGSTGADPRISRN